jgi:hypothetical protein
MLSLDWQILNETSFLNSDLFCTSVLLKKTTIPFLESLNSYTQPASKNSLVFNAILIIMFKPGGTVVL